MLANRASRTTPTTSISLPVSLMRPKRRPTGFWPDQKVRADNADYDVTKEVAVFTGNVVAVRGQDVITSQSLTVNLETSAADSSGPFRGVFYPKSSKTQ